MIWRRTPASARAAGSGKPPREAWAWGRTNVEEAASELAPRAGGRRGVRVRALVRGAGVGPEVRDDVVERVGVVRRPARVRGQRERGLRGGAVRGRGGRGAGAGEEGGEREEGERGAHGRGGGARVRAGGRWK